ncbi:hypothetical protein BH09PLA1_BH09PLA1_32590 [soil metagenome]
MNFRLALATGTLALIAIGCASDRATETSPNPEIPRTAVYAKEAQGRLWFRASDDGVAYVYDADTTQLVFAAQMKKEQRLLVEPEKDRATVEGKPVFEKPMARAHTHRIYFQPGGKLPPPEKPAAPLELNSANP